MDERRGGPEVLRVVQEPLREPGRGGIRVRTIASGVSFADIFMREGFHPETLLRSLPFTGRPNPLRLATTSLGWLRAFAYNAIPSHERLRLYSIQMKKRRSPELFRADLSQLLGLLAGREIAPFVEARLPLAEAPRAHELLASGTTSGKIVLTA
jgi:NADPH:quinone reductase-like Zn-dependent oxidoreductase